MMKNNHFEFTASKLLALTLLVLIYQVPGNAAKTYFRTEPGVDRPGYDISDVELDVADHRYCRSLCANLKKCLAYTYVKPGVQGSKARCYLKRVYPAAKCSTCCTSGIRLEKNQPEPEMLACESTNSDASPAIRAPAINQAGKMQAGKEASRDVANQSAKGQADLVVQKNEVETDAVCPTNQVCGTVCCPAGNSCDSDTLTCVACPNPTDTACTVGSCCPAGMNCTDFEGICCPQGQTFCGGACEPLSHCIK